MKIYKSLNITPESNILTFYVTYFPFTLTTPQSVFGSICGYQHAQFPWECGPIPGLILFLMSLNTILLYEVVQELVFKIKVQGVQDTSHSPLQHHEKRRAIIVSAPTLCQIIRVTFHSLPLIRPFNVHINGIIVPRLHCTFQYISYIEILIDFYSF